MRLHTVTAGPVVLVIGQEWGKGVDCTLGVTSCDRACFKIYFSHQDQDSTRPGEEHVSNEQGT